MHSKRLKPTILMADDDEDDFFLVRNAFDESGTEGVLHLVPDGEELMDYLAHRGKYEDRVLSPRPDLILLDLNMPRIDGRAALQMIKADPKLRCIPIVILTTSSEESDIARSYSLGANSFITKPMAFQDLVTMIELLSRYWFGVVQLPSDRNGCRGGE